MRWRHFQRQGFQKRFEAVILSREHGGNIREAEEVFGYPAGRILDFSANINPLGLPAGLKDIIINSINSIIHYPDPECKMLKEGLADFLGVKASNLLIGNGSTELIFLAPKAISPRKVLIPVPSFSEYEKSAKTQSKSKVLFMKTAEDEGFKIKIENLIKLFPKADLVFICNPNNPTGSLIPKEDIIYLAKACRNQRPIIVIDEAFIEFVKNEGNYSVIKEAARLSNLLVLRSFTKFFAIPGLRLGYLAGNRKLISRLSRYQFPWNVNSIAQAVGKEIIKDKGYIRRSKEFIIQQRIYLYERLKRIHGLVPHPPTANFIFCKLNNTTLSSKILFKELGRRGTLIRDCSNFRGLNDRYIRVAVRKRDENVRLITALAEVLG